MERPWTVWGRRVDGFPPSSTDPRDRFHQIPANARMGSRNVRQPPPESADFAPNPGHAPDLVERGNSWARSGRFHPQESGEMVEALASCQMLLRVSVNYS